MTSLARRLARPEILSLPPLDVATDEGLANAVNLHRNENPYPPMDGGPLAAGLNRYPEPQPADLRRAMAALYGVQPDDFVVTRGGDDAIDILMRAFCRPGEDAVAVCNPTFTAYEHFARVQGARVVAARLDDSFDFNPDLLLDAVAGEPNLKLAFICSPNNPTGNPVAPERILAAADALPDTLVVLDEAYLEYSALESLASEAVARDNLVILRTLSKAWGLAGARVGGLIGPAETIELVARALPPFPLPSLSIEAALAALAPARRALHAERIARTLAERERLESHLAGAPGVRRVWPSAGNFLFLEVEDPAALERRLRALGVRVRYRSNAAPGGVRLTVGTEDENALALAAFGVDAAAVSTRRAEVVRDTKETRIAVAVDLDRAAPRRITTGLPFYDHMLDQVAAHGGFSLILSCDGDLEIDAHHSVEDCAIAFGQALAGALGDRRGIGRFGFSLPMDEAEAHVLVDLSGRPYSRFEGNFSASHIGAYPTEMTAHVFRSFADTLGAAVHVRVEGENDHHKTEACFKAFGRALRQAVARTDTSGAVPSTKGVL
jgi:histidinol-phosphate aminotransferase/imidazoleglycerol-phosphate dehydratase/histidinol-phosphatase